MAARVKADILNTYYRGVLATTNADELQRVRRAMSPETLLRIDTPAAASEWLPIAVYDDLLRASFEHGYDRDLGRVMERTRVATRQRMNTVYRGFFKLLSPEYVARRLPVLWRTTFENNGKVEVELATGQALVKFSGNTIPSRAFWESWRCVGFQLLALSRVKEMRVDLDVASDASPDALFKASWR